MTASAILEGASIDDLDDFVDFGEAAYELGGSFLNKETAPALCSALGIAQPAWSGDCMDKWQPLGEASLGEAILMALGITAPATVLTAIYRQCRMG